jgi:hypothetical protein
MRQRYHAHRDLRRALPPHRIRVSFNTVDDSDIRVKFSLDPPVRVARRTRRLPVSESVTLAVGALSLVRHLSSRHLSLAGRRPVITVDDHGGEGHRVTGIGRVNESHSEVNLMPVMTRTATSTDMLSFSSLEWSRNHDAVPL